MHSTDPASRRPLVKPRPNIPTGTVPDHFRLNILKLYLAGTAFRERLPAKYSVAALATDELVRHPSPRHGNFRSWGEVELRGLAADSCLLLRRFRCDRRVDARERDIECC